MRRKSNPLDSTVKRSGPGRVNIDFDGQTLHGLQFATPMLTIGGTAVGIYPVDCSIASSAGTSANVRYEAIARSLTGITKLYNEYVFRSVTCTWIPSVSPGIADGGGQINICYVDNPEEMSSYFTLSDSTLFATSKAVRNSKTFNAWERFTFSVPLTRRIKSFNVNQNTGTGDVNQFMRSTQGFILVGASAISPIAQLGQWKITYTMDLKGLNFLQAT